MDTQVLVLKKDPDLTITISSNAPHFDYVHLQHIATKNGISKAITDFKDEYFITMQWKDNDPHLMASLANGGLYSDGVYRITKIYIKDQMPIMVSKAQITHLFHITDYIPEIDCKLFFGSRGVNDHPWARIANMTGNSDIDEENVYMVGVNPDKKSTWKHIYYSGDISLLTIPKMSLAEYKERFKEYEYTDWAKDWCKPAIENSKFLFDKFETPSKVLEVGTFEGAYTFWLADNYKLTVDTVDPFDGTVYNVSKEDFNFVYNNFKHNLDMCVNKDNVTLHNDNSYDVLKRMTDIFDFIYVDGSHIASNVLEDLVLSFKLLKKGGIMLMDDATAWKYRDQLTKEVSHDIGHAPRLAVDSFIHCNWADIKVINLPAGNQVAIQKL